MWIVELESGVWLAPIEGDPGRTLKEESATKFVSEDLARWALKGARKYRPFKNARVSLGLARDRAVI